MKYRFFNFSFSIQIILILLPVLVFMSCSDDENSSLQKITIPSDYPFQAKYGAIQYQNNEWVRHGVNCMNTFGIDDTMLMSEWKVAFVREFIGNLRQQPISEAPIQGADGAWLHPLQAIADRNRNMGMVTLFCPFGWVDEAGNQTLFAGKNPREEPYYEAYKKRMQEIARQFKNQPDVWIEVWNEPYHWNNENDYSHRKWLDDQRDMVNNLRQISEFYNIIVVPGNEMGQSENAILHHGQTLLQDHDNIVFDLHAYRKWLFNVNENDIRQRIEGLTSKGLPIIFGEVGVFNVERPLLNPNIFLSVVAQSKIPTLAWAWVVNEGYPNSLLTKEQKPNDIDNNNWGSTYKTFLLENNN